MDEHDKHKLVYAKLCTKALGLVISSTREEGKKLGLSVDETRMIWKKVLEITATDGGKLHEAI